MHHFFAEPDNINEREIYITGEDYNHAVNVLRLRRGEKVLISGPDAVDYICTVSGSVREDGSTGDACGVPGAQGVQDRLRLIIDGISSVNRELPARVILYQCLPKSDKMELIIQKAVELGVSRIVPVTSKNCVMKLDARKAESRHRRWQAIAQSAAKQSCRSVVPQVGEVMSLKDALIQCEDCCDVRIIPYENECGLTSTCEAIISFLPGTGIGVFIGPEGGFDPMEIKMAMRHGVRPVSLGSRILRTETAAIAILSLIMIRLEIASENNTF